MSIQSVIPLILLVVVALGGWLWWQSVKHPAPEPSPGIPDVYTAVNVRRHVDHYVEQDGVVQAFRVDSIHHSGYFFVEVLPPDGCQLNRDFPRVCGWVRELSSSQLIEVRGLLKALPVEHLFVVN